MSLGERIRGRRKELGLSQPELATRAGTDGNQVSRWERDVVAPSTENLQRVAAALEMSVDELAGYSIDLAERLAALEQRVAELER